MKIAHKAVENDHGIWLRFRNGEEEAFSTIFHTYYSFLYHYGVKMAGGDKDTAKDCIQDMFLSLWRTRESLGEVRSIRFYLLKAYRRKVIRTLASRQGPKAHQALSDDYSFELVFSFEESLIAKELFKEQQDSLAEAVAALSFRQREAIYLKFYKGLSYEEISEIMGLQYQSVRNYVHQGICILRKKLTVPVTLTLLALLRLEDYC
jgi:RNA polymerase sigma factor (sigma-70 family)